MIFRDKEYKINIKNSVTLFSPMGSSIGDQVLFTTVLKKYKKDNPDELVLNFEGYVFFGDLIDKHKPKKIFWADVTNFMPKPNIRNNIDIIDYCLIEEADDLARHGVYPELWFDELPPVLMIDNYVVLHLRNIKKAKSKNVTTDEANGIINLLTTLYLEGAFDKVILIGNDDNVFEHALPEFVIDMRYGLTLAHIVYLCERAKLFIGKDSGLGHVVGCADVPMVMWGFRDRIWFPKVMISEQLVGFTREDEFKNVLEEVNRKLH